LALGKAKTDHQIQNKKEEKELAFSSAKAACLRAGGRGKIGSSTFLKIELVRHIELSTGVGHADRGCSYISPEPEERKRAA